MNPKAISVDQGTTATKTAVWDEINGLALVSNRKHRQIYPQSGWVEHDPLELVDNVRRGIELGRQALGGSEASIGIDNQGETIVAWDARSKEPIYNAIVWQDDRTQSQIDDLKSQGAEDETLRRAGLPLDPYFSASKMRWILDHVADAKRLLRKNRLRIATSDAFFLNSLTGVYATDPGTASRTSLMNLESRQWDEELCALFGIPVEILPEIRSTTDDFGVVDELNCRVTANIVDQQAALFGHGCVGVGDAKVTFGTGAFALANTGHAIVRESQQKFLPTLAWELQGDQPVYAIDAGLYNAGSAVEWLLKTSLANSVEELNEFDSTSAASRGIYFVPALSGLGCPYWDRSASALWIGMNLNTSRADLCQAVIEGVAFRASQLIDCLNEHIELSDVIPIDGGMSGNPYFCQFFADLVQREVVVPQIAETTALGTAMLSLTGAGVNSETPEKSTREFAARYQPVSSLAEEKVEFAEAVNKCRQFD